MRTDHTPGKALAARLLTHAVHSRALGSAPSFTECADELVPRMAGPLELAPWRENARAARIPCTMLTAAERSRAWGLADEGLDTDVRGAFASPFTWTAGLVSPPVDLVSADGSRTFWEARKLAR